MRRLRHFLLLGLVSVGLVVPASAQAEIVTVGSPLTAAFSPTTIGLPATLINSSFVQPGGNLTSPISGVIVRWRITQATGGPFALRVLTRVSGQTFTGGAASAPQTPASTATQTYPTNIPIQAGQFVGVDDTDDNDQIGFAFGGSFSYWNPKLENGQTRVGTGPSFVGEVGFNADVATIPSNDFTLGKVKKNKKKGIATITVDVPGPGELKLSGPGVKAQRAGGATISKQVTEAGKVNLKVKARGAKKSKLLDTGKVKVKTNITYTPAGDVPGIGTPSTETKKIKLVDN